MSNSCHRDVLFETLFQVITVYVWWIMATQRLDALYLIIAGILSVIATLAFAEDDSP